MIGIACIYYSLTTLNEQDIDAIIGSFNNAKYKWVIFGVILGALSHLSRSYRWRYLLEPLGYKISFLNSVLAIFSGYLINTQRVKMNSLRGIYLECNWNVIGM